MTRQGERKLAMTGQEERGLAMTGMWSINDANVKLVLVLNLHCTPL